MAFSSQIIYTDYINSMYALDARPNPNEENVWFNLQDYLSVIQNINLNDVFQEEVQEGEVQEGEVQGERVEIIIYRPGNIQEVEREQEQEQEQEQEVVHEVEIDQAFDIQLYVDFIHSLNTDTPIILEELTKIRLNSIAYFCGIVYTIPEYELLLCLNYVKNHVTRQLVSGSFSINDILEHDVPQNSIYLFGSCDVCFESLYSQYLQIIICCRRQHAFHPTCIYGSTYYRVNSIDCQICHDEGMDGIQGQDPDVEEIEEREEDVEREREIRERDAILEETWDQYYHNSGQEENVSEILELDNPEDDLRENIEVIVDEEDEDFIPFLVEEAEGEESIYGSMAICEHSVVLCQPISTDVFGDCPVCYDPMIAANITITRCGHIFHASCMFDAIIRKKTCPLCRTVLCF
jgi:hypothetical protein